MPRPLWSRPGEAAIEAYLAARRSRGEEGRFSYPEVGASSSLGEPLPEPLAGRYDLDHHRVALGHGREVFARARSAPRLNADAEKCPLTRRASFRR